MAEKESSDKWTIPYNLGYDNFTKILKALYQKKGDENAILSKEISKITDIGQKTIGGNLSFFTNIGVLDGNGQAGYKLTPRGNEYAKAIYENNLDNIKKCVEEIVENSHLKKLKEYVEFNKKSLSLSGLNNFVKREGQFSSEKNSENMLAPYYTGSKTLYEIFKTAEIIPKEFQISTTRENKPKSKNKIKQQKKQVKVNKQILENDKITAEPTGEFTILKTSEFSLSLKKNLDESTFEHIKSQINGEIEFRRKQANSKTKSQNN